MRDFFDEEYQKFTEKPNLANNANVPPPPSSYTAKNTVVRKILLVALIAGVFILGILLGSLSSATNEWGILQDVVKEYKNNSIYYDEETWDETFKQMIVNAGTYMLQTTDNYGFVLSPQELYEIVYPADGSSVPTFGFAYSSSQVGLYVTSVSYGSGAYKAGLQNGDIILFANRGGYSEVSFKNADQDAKAEILSGSWGTTVTFTVMRGFDQITSEETDGAKITIMDIMVTKEKYENNFVDYYFASNNVTSVGKTDITDDKIKEILSLNVLEGAGVGYIRINSFEALYDENQNEVDSASLQFAAAMEAFKETYAGKGKLILDLRGNPGGSVSEAVKIATYLVYDFANPNNRSYLITKMKGQNSQILDTYYSEGNIFADYFDVQIASKTPRIVVLTDGNSASASELLLGCVLDYGTGIQIGETTYGKGIAQTVKTLNYVGPVEIQSAEGVITTTFNYGIYYTFAKYYSPVSDTNIHGVGYTPEFFYQLKASDNFGIMTKAVNYFN